MMKKLRSFAIGALLAVAGVASATLLFTSSNGDINFPGLTPTTIDNMAIGSKTASTGAFTALTATTINGTTFTPGSGTIAIAAGKTFIDNNTLTLTGTDGTTITFPTTSASVARTDAAQTFTGNQSITGAVSILSTGSLNLGTAGTAVGQVAFSNATSGAVTVQPGTGALGTPTVTLPTLTGTLPTATTCGTIAAAGACANTQSATGITHMIAGIATLAGGTSLVTGISPAFTSSSTFYCTTNDVTTASNSSKGVPASASTVTFTGTGTDNIQFICMGS